MELGSVMGLVVGLVVCTYRGCLRIYDVLGRHKRILLCIVGCLIAGNVYAGQSSIPGYNREGNYWSVESLQGALHPTASELSLNMDLLAMNVRAPSFMSSGNNGTVKERGLSSDRGGILGFQGVPGFSPDNKSYRGFFSSRGGLNTRPGRSAYGFQLGFSLTPSGPLTVGVAYSYSHAFVKNQTGIDDELIQGRAQTETWAHSFSGIGLWNPDKEGFTGSLCISQGWGSVKNKRTFSHGSRTISTEGIPTTGFFGIKTELGYTMDSGWAFGQVGISDLEDIDSTIMPYIRITGVSARWKAYKESSGSILPARISSMEEIAWEGSLGVVYGWSPVEHFVCKPWISVILGRKSLDEILGIPLEAKKIADEFYVQSKTTQYIQGELGFSLNMDVRTFFDSTEFEESLGVGVYGSIRTKNSIGLSSQNIGLQIWYDF